MRALGLLGGTFDPIHVGHLRLAVEVRERESLERVSLIPAPQPRLRERPRVDAATRLRLVREAVDGVAGLDCDGRELGAGGPTRTIDTLRELRGEHPGRALCWIVGADAAARLDRWHDWEALITVAHLIIARRPGADLPSSGPVATLIAEHADDDRHALHRREHGVVRICDVPGIDVSATGVRERLASGRAIDFLVPANVQHLLLNEGLYIDG